MHEALARIYVLGQNLIKQGLEVLDLRKICDLPQKNFYSQPLGVGALIILFLDSDIIVNELPIHEGVGKDAWAC